MADNPGWHRSLLGRAKAAFNKAKASPPPPAKPGETTAGRGSDMVKKTKPVLDGPKPPGGARHLMKQQEFRRDMAKESQAAKSAPRPETRQIQRPVIELEHLKEGARLREQFKKAAEKDRDKGR
jgi:hypothetical protein